MKWSMWWSYHASDRHYFWQGERLRIAADVSSLWTWRSFRSLPVGSLRCCQVNWLRKRGSRCGDFDSHLHSGIQVNLFLHVFPSLNAIKMKSHFNRAWLKVLRLWNIHRPLWSRTERDSLSSLRSKENRELEAPRNRQRGLWRGQKMHICTSRVAADVDSATQRITVLNFTATALQPMSVQGYNSINTKHYCYNAYLRLIVYYTSHNFHLLFTNCPTPKETPQGCQRLKTWCQDRRKIFLKVLRIFIKPSGCRNLPQWRRGPTKSTIPSPCPVLPNRWGPIFAPILENIFLRMYSNSG